MKEIFCSPHVLLGQSDAGAHVANANPGFGYSPPPCSRYWVRERQIMSLEDAIKKLTFLPASVFGIRDRGLLRRGMAADIFVFDPATIDLAEPEKVQDLPEGAPRYIQGAKGIHYTIVNGSVLMKNGAHTGVYPGRVLRQRIAKKFRARKPLRQRANPIIALEIDDLKRVLTRARLPPPNYRQADGRCSYSSRRSCAGRRSK